jgi:Domain of unknown function (DUF1906)
VAQSFGVDTQSSHLDSIKWAAFQTWNSGLVPAFAGRNFIGGKFLWAPAEATTALDKPHPDDFTKLAILTPLIAPIQGMSTTRQQVAGDLGTLYGQIDADAICNRLSAAMATGELTTKDSNPVNVYLQVDPAAAFSADYWAGWAHKVFNATFTKVNSDGSSYTIQPYQPCIMCAFRADGAVLRIDPHVPAAIQAAQDQHRELRPRCFGFWADAPDFDPALQRPNAVIDWSRFAPTTAPIWLWRFATTLLTAAGQPIAAPPLPIAADAINHVGMPARFGWEFMLETWEWQPSNNVTNNGFSSSRAVGGSMNVLNGAVVPAETRVEGCGTFTMPGGPLKIIGRYIRQTAALTTFDGIEVLAVSATPIKLFTTYEVTAGATDRDYYNPDHHNGRGDGAMAFLYAATHLHQPPQTPIFFAIDWSTDDDTDLESKTWLTGYIADIKAAYNDYIAANPNRPYLMGVYGTGLTCGWMYEQGIVSHFWQAASMCRKNSAPPFWPWPHATRWQTFPNPPFNPAVGGIGGEDLDCDWGDGGNWSLSDGLNPDLMRVELQAVLDALAQIKRAVFGNLLDPAAP